MSNLTRRQREAYNITTPEEIGLANVGQYGYNVGDLEDINSAHYYSLKSKEWAVSDEEVEEGLFSSKYSANRAQDIVDNFQSSVEGEIDDILQEVIDEGDKQVARVEAADAPLSSPPAVTLLGA